MESLSSSDEILDITKDKSSALNSLRGENISVDILVDKIVNFELFNSKYYTQQSKLKFENPHDAILHYLKEGYKKKYHPHLLFDSGYYVNSNPEIQAFEINPLVHFIEIGAKEYKKPHPLIDLKYLASQGVEVDENLKLISYFYKHGNSQYLNPHPLFDTYFYLNENSDVEESNINALVHFLLFGGAEKRDPHPLFDSSYYFSYDKNLNPNLINPLSHYICNVVDFPNHHPNPLFNSIDYYNNYPDVRENRMNPLEHFVLHGRDEGRQSSAAISNLLNHVYKVTSVDLERNNWKGEKIIITSHDASRTGAPLIILKIVEELVKRYNVDCTIILLEGGPLLEDFSKLGNLVFFPEVWQTAGGSVAGVRQVLFELLKEKPLFALCNSAQSHPVIKMLNYFKLPVFSLVHEFANPYDKRTFHQLIHSSKKVIFPASLVQQAAFKKIELETENTIILPQGLLNPNFPNISKADARQKVIKEFELDEDVFIFFGCGYVDMRKGCDLFVQSAKQFFLKNPDANAVFIWMGQFDLLGGGSLFRQWVFQDIETSNLEDKVLFIGERKDVDQYYVAADAFLMLSRLDPFPCVVHEAMAAGLPIILFEDATGSIEAIGTGGGYSVPYLDIKSVSEKLLELYSNPAKKAEMSSYNQKRVNEIYNFSEYVSQLTNFILTDLGLKSLHKRDAILQTHTNKKIIITCSDWWISGVNNLIEAIGAELIKKGWDFEILFTRSQSQIIETAKRKIQKTEPSSDEDIDLIIEPVEDEYEVQLPKVPYKFLKVSNGYSNANIWHSLINYLENQAPCIYLTGYDYIANAISPALSDKVAVVGWNHADDLEYYEQANRLGRYWNAQICVSQQIKKEIDKINPTLETRNFFITNSTILSEDILEEKSAPIDKIRIVYTGRIVQYQKRVLEFVDLVHSLEAINLDYELIIIGEDQDGSKLILEEKLESQIKEGKVIFTGRLYKEEIFEILKNSHFFVLLSDFEGMPISLIEAMSQGCIPVVPDMKSGIPEIVKNNFNGFILDTRDYSTWADIFAEIGLNNEKYLAISRNVITTIKEGYTADIIGNKFNNLFEEVLEEVIRDKYQRPEVLKWLSKTGDVLPPQNLLT